MSPRTLVALTLAVAALLLAAAPAAQARVPFGWVGTVADGPLLLNPAVDFDREADVMAGAGIESMRVVLSWRDAQRYASWDDVPLTVRDRYRDEGGVPTDFSRADRVIGAAAQRGMTVLPVIMIAPDWAARHPGAFSSPPKGTDAYARFASALTRRYGPGGSFWTEHPELRPRPVRAWQIWNEPSMREFWHDRPWAKDYVALLRAARIEIKRADPKAKIVLAGLPNKSWNDLRRIYRIRGARRYFDAVAFHPFTGKVGGVVEILRRNRRVMRRYRDARTPLYVTELSWPSARGKVDRSYGIETTERGQATRARKALRVLAKHRRSLRIKGVYWYTWMTADERDDYPFDYAGASRLRDGKVVRKPAFYALRKTALQLRGCKSKPSGARSCKR